MIGLLAGLLPADLRIAGLVLLAGAGAAAVTAAGAIAYDRIIDDPAVIAEARRGFVAEATVAALEARLEGQRLISERLASLADERARRLKVAEAAQLGLAERLSALRAEKEDLDDDLAGLLSRAHDPRCAVDGDLAHRLRAP